MGRMHFGDAAVTCVVSIDAAASAGPPVRNLVGIDDGLDRLSAVHGYETLKGKVQTEVPIHLIPALSMESWLP